MIYHVGLIKGTGLTKCWANGHRKSTVVVELRRDIDYLSTDLWRYMGRRETTKKQIKADKIKLLAAINEQYQTSFTHIVID